MIQSNRPLQKMTEEQLEEVFEQIRTGQDGDEIVLYGIPFILSKIFPGSRVGSVYLTTKDSRVDEFNKCQASAWQGRVFHVPPDYKDYITHLRLGTCLGNGSAVFGDWNELVQTIKSGNCNIG